MSKKITHCLSCGEWLGGMDQCSECGPSINDGSINTRTAGIFTFFDTRR